MTEDNKQLKILLIDDDHFLLDMYLLKFKKYGILVDTSPNSITALESIRGGKVYDIVLVDIIMPGMDGLDFMTTIRSEKLLPKAVFIILTNETDSKEKTKNLGVLGYIIKATATPSEVVEQVLEIYKNK